VVYSTNTGRALINWFEFYGTWYDVPVLGLHPPPALGQVERVDVNAAVQQLFRLTSRLEETVHRRLDVDALSRIVSDTAAATGLWSEILDLARTVPAPFTFFDTLIHITPMVLLRGTPEAVDYYRLLKAELEDRVARGVAAVPGERSRFYWDGPPIWCALRPLARFFAERQATIVASTLGESFVLKGLDRADPIESMARTYTGVFANRSEAYQTAYLTAHIEEYGADAAIFHDCRTSPETSYVRYGLAAKVARLTNLPGFVLEADSHDLRLFSLDQVQSLLADFIERQAVPVGPA
jgi:benzoyl-CoA reductase/2-hydroxyglutaryl-CoA dehydratase subunit BcrC/BadD/HgdB